MHYSTGRDKCHRGKQINCPAPNKGGRVGFKSSPSRGRCRQPPNPSRERHPIRGGGWVQVHSPAGAGRWEHRPWRNFILSLLVAGHGGYGIDRLKRCCGGGDEEQPRFIDPPHRGRDVSRPPQRSYSPFRAGTPYGSFSGSRPRRSLAWGREGCLSWPRPRRCVVFCSSPSREEPIWLFSSLRHGQSWASRFSRAGSFSNGSPRARSLVSKRWPWG